MALITKQYTFSAGATILASEHNQNFDVLYNWANGNVDNANIKASAGINFSKMALGDDFTLTGDVNFTSAATTDDIVTITGSSLTTGSALRVYSNSASTSTRSLLHIINDHADADDTVCLLIQQDGVDYAIDCGSGKIRGDITGNTLPAGSTVQVVYHQRQDQVTCNTAIPLNNNTRISTEGNQILTKAITPKSATNILKIDVSVVGQTGAAHCCAFVMNGTTTLAVTRQYTDAGIHMGLTYFMVAGTTDAITFNVNAGSESGSLLVNYGLYDNGKEISSLTITEIQV
jgi:hypothetical protein